MYPNLCEGTNMLNFDVKRKINTLRDILVGKVPDPKAQVEQITIALIYKFMDDMDLQGAEFGGNRVFFTGDYEKFAFSQIMLSEHSAQERLNLYAEGIDKMTNNPGLPQLFREILRNTYIPYRDPETLNRFLKEIAEFSYDDSEDLGNAFEYLLSIMGSQGDAGQFRTPRHIIDMMVKIIAPQKNESILDPACGTAGFLISAYNYIKKQNTDANGQSTLTADDKNRMIENFAGYDISPDMVRLSRVNMYLHGFTTPHISEYDTLTSLEKWYDNYDVILANPPFMTPKGGITPHSNYRTGGKRAEILFVDYIIQHLNSNGRAAIIVPEGIVFQSQTAYKNLRKILVNEKYLYGVISLPTGVFNPYSGVKTSILLIDRALAKERNSILFVKLNNDGYDLGAQRREIKGSEIPDVLNVVKAYRDGKDISRYKNSIIVEKSAISEQEYILVGERYNAPKQMETVWPMVRIGDICKTASGGTPLSSVSEYYHEGTINWLKSGEVANGYIYSTETKISEAGLANSSAKIFPQNTVLVAMYGATAGQVGLLKIESATNQAVCGIYPNETILPEYLYHILKTQRERFIALSTGGAQPNISQNVIKNFCVPLPPVTVQKEIVAEIASYQKIIDGAQQVIDNYKPVIRVDPEWEVVEIGAIAKLKYGYTATAQDSGTARFVRITDISSVGQINDFNEKYIDAGEDSEEYLLKRGDIIVARTGATYGKTAVFNADYPAVYASFLIKIDFPKELVLSDYYWAFAQSDMYWKQANALMSGGAQPQFNANAIAHILVPIPPISVQKVIVNQVREELAIVNQNKRIIEIFQQKIAEKIAEVWGE